MTKAFAKILSPSSSTNPGRSALELLCPVHNLVSLRAAVDNGADSIRLDYRADDSGSMAWMDYQHEALLKGIHYAHERACKVEINLTAPVQSNCWSQLRTVIDNVVATGADAIILADPALMLYAASHHEQFQLYYATPASALHPESINYFQQHLGISRIVLPRVVSLAQVRRISQDTSVDVEIAGFGPLCSLIDGRNPEVKGSEYAASNSAHLHVAHMASTGQSAAVEDASNDEYFPQSRSPDISALRLLPDLMALRVSAIKIEALEAVPGHLAQITRVWREAIDCCLENPASYFVRQSWIAELDRTTKRLSPK